MSEEAQKSSSPTASKPEGGWQPLTFGGVAAFARGSWWRLLLAQLIVAALAAASVVWFLERCYTPVISQFIQMLPPGAGLDHGQISGVAGAPMAETRFLSLAITGDAETDLDQSADVQVVLRKSGVEISTLLSSALGSLEFDYGTNATLDLSREAMEPVWGAWRPVVLAGAGVGVILALLAIWAVLAVIYAPAAKFVAWFGDRQLTWGGAWRLGCAALLPGALVLTLGIILYGRQTADLIGLGYFDAVHFLVGWVYVLGAPLFAPRIPGSQPSRNPFAS